MGCSKSSPKREVYSNTTLPRETRKTLNRQPNFTPKTTAKRRKKKDPKLVEGNKSLRSEQKYMKKEMKETIVKISKTKSQFFEKINKIDKLLAIFIMKKKEKAQINKIRNEKGQVRTDNAEIQRIIRDYYEQLYGNKMDNLEETGRFLEKLNLPRLNQEEIKIMNNPITNTEIETVIKKISPKTKAQSQMASQGNSINQRRTNAYFSETSKKLQRKEHFQTHSTRPQSP